jgi:hypothetical protein
MLWPLNTLFNISHHEYSALLDCGPLLAAAPRQPSLKPAGNSGKTKAIALITQTLSGEV